MPAVLDRLKSTVYTSVGINLLIADAIVGREVATPKFATDGDITARQQATDALTGFRSRTAPTTEKLIGKLRTRFPTPLASDSVPFGTDSVLMSREVNQMPPQQRRTPTFQPVQHSD